MDDDNHDALRARMVAEQLEGRGIIDQRVLAAFRRVPRHRFVPEDQIAFAYEDRPLPLPQGQTISQPLMVAIMLQAAKLTGEENVLEIGTGSGYQTALLTELAGKVTSVERLASLAEGARRTLNALGYGDVEIVVDDGTKGFAPNAPYDCILVAAGAPRVPEPLAAQLKVGGRLIIPVGPLRDQTLAIATRAADGDLSIRDEGWCAFVPLIGACGWPEDGSPNAGTARESS